MANIYRVVQIKLNQLVLENVHIVGLVYNYRISLFENFTGETKNVIKLFLSDCFFSNFKVECKKVCLSG